MSDIANKAEEVKGKAKEKVGEWTGNRGMKNEGMAEKAKAKAEKVVDDAKDTAKRQFNL